MKKSLIEFRTKVRFFEPLKLFSSSALVQHCVIVCGWDDGTIRQFVCASLVASDNGFGV